MAEELKRTYTIPLRKEFLKVPKYKRAKKAVSALKKFAMRHMKISDKKNVKIGRFLNELVWAHGIRNPPHHVKVNILKDAKENKVMLELFGKDIGFYKQKEGKKAGITDKVKEKLGIKEEEKEEKKGGIAEKVKEKFGVKEENAKTKEDTQDTKHAAEAKEKAETKKEDDIPKTEKNIEKRENRAAKNIASEKGIASEKEIASKKEQHL